MIYGWDASHYDGTLTPAILARAKAEGIAFFTHKLGQGLSNIDDTAPTALAAARDAGIQVIGGYYFIDHGTDMVAQARRCLALANLHEPWWHTFPGWFWQTDAETSPSGMPTFAEIKAFSDALDELSGRRVIVYASAGQYGNRLAGLGHLLWNAHYGANTTGSFRALYPGDHSSGWNAYSGQAPALLQYGSGATIAGRTTCDANAFRGTTDQLLALIGAKPHTPTGGTTDMPLTQADADLVADTILKKNVGASGPSVATCLQRASSGAVEIAAEDAELATLLAGNTALAAAVAGLPAAVVAALPPVTVDGGGGATVAEVEQAVHDGLATLRLTTDAPPAAPVA